MSLNIKNKIQCWIRACLQCGSIFSVGECLLCPVCEKKLFEFFASDTVRVLDGLLCYNLFLWAPDQNTALSHVLENLKGNHLLDAQKFYALKMLKKFISQSEGQQTPVLIPAPASSRGQPDHALNLANYISIHTGWPCLNILARSVAGPQKDKNKRQRAQIQMYVHESFSLSKHKNHRFVFVDDIVTTGSTIQAAHRALGRPRDFVALTIADRRLATFD